MRNRKTVVAVSFEEETLRPLRQLREMNFPLGDEIHLVHVVPVIIYARGMDLSAQSYPMKEERPQIENAILARLVNLKKELFPEHDNVVYKCLFDMNEKAVFADYVAAQKADLVIVATRGKHGIMTLFDSSFAQHQVKYSPANVLVLR